MENGNHRNMTLSFKVAAEEKILLKQLAEKYNVSLSEFIYNLVICNKDQYEYIGKITPREEQLAKNLREEKKQNAKQAAAIENAVFRVDMERNRADKAIHEKDELTYQLKEEKAEKEDFKQQFFNQQKLAQDQQKLINQLRKNVNQNQLELLGATVLGVTTGVILKR